MTVRPERRRCLWASCPGQAEAASGPVKYEGALWRWVCTLCGQFWEQTGYGR